MADGTGLVTDMKTNKKIDKKIVSISIMAVISLLLSGCSQSATTYENYVPEVSEVSSISPVGTVLNTESYEGEESVSEEVEKSFSSEDGLCVIEKKPSYYEVYLDYTGGDYGAVGRAYGETIKKLGFDFEEIMEPYLYENINMAFPNLGNDYTPVVERITELKKNIPEDYLNEINGFAEALSDGFTGMESDGKISYEEALLMQMVPDALRGTNCNALSVWGDKTVTGDKINSRTLEWSLGSENQMCKAQAVTHFKMGEGKNSYVTFSVLGMLDMLTGINDKEVMVGILDVGSGLDYECEGKKCYTYELRYALENMADARSIGEYMVSESRNFTYSHNILITDKKDSFVAEDCVIRLCDIPEAERQELDNDFDPKAVLRDKDTPLMEGITWDNPDSLCVINAFMSDGTDDYFTASDSNFVRFSKFNTWVGDKEKLSVSDVKDIVTRETVDMPSGIQKLHSEIVFQTIIYDYSTGNIEVCFTGEEGVVNHPDFVKIEADF